MAPLLHLLLKSQLFWLAVLFTAPLPLLSPVSLMLITVTSSTLSNIHIPSMNECVLIWIRFFCFLFLLTLVPPKITSLSKDIVVNEGSNVSLVCSASGKPDPTVSWKIVSPAGKTIIYSSYQLWWNGWQLFVYVEFSLRLRDVSSSVITVIAGLWSRSNWFTECLPADNQNSFETDLH